jgi:hypothetical protein
LLSRRKAIPGLPVEDGIDKDDSTGDTRLSQSHMNTLQLGLLMSEGLTAVIPKRCHDMVWLGRIRGVSVTIERDAFDMSPGDHIVERFWRSWRTFDRKLLYDRTANVLGATGRKALERTRERRDEMPTCSMVESIGTRGKSGH